MLRLGEGDMALSCRVARKALSDKDRPEELREESQIDI